MKIFLAIITLCAWVNAANLLTYNVYERTDRVDVMLSFDAPHEGSITQKNETNAIILTINDLGYDKMIEKSINSEIIQELTILPEKNNTLQIILKSNKNISVVASKTVDGFGLRIRSSILQASSTSQNTALQTPSSSTSAPSNFEFVDTRYIIVIAILLILIALMLWIKRRMAFQTTNKPMPSRSSWLFSPKTTNSGHEVTLLHKKIIDNQNSIVLFEYGSIKYLVMTGSSNLLLEKFQNGEVKDDNDFEKVFEENRRRLDEYLKLQDTSKQQNSYKDKASADYAPYDDTH